MGRPKRWTESEIVGGVGTVTLHSWRYFLDFVYQQMLDYESYIWRGQRCDNWLLDSTFDRLVRRLRLRSPAIAGYRRQHLERFKYAVRGRRGVNPLQMTDENDWWALGQHHGLATPLLDWAHSPFAAAYFAFMGTGPDQTSRRAIYAIHQPSVEKRSREIHAAAHKAEAAAGKVSLLPEIFTPVSGRPPVEFFRPLSDENARLVSQGGLFSRAPDGVDLESWVKAEFATAARAYTIMKITIPNRDRVDCLRSLNRMNINHLTLFPDLYGASKYCNQSLEIKNY